MAFDVKTRSGPLVACHRGYRRTCGTAYKQLRTSLAFNTESVESYRGKHEFIHVGQRKVRKYQPFKRYKISATRSTDYWCAEGNNTFWGEDTTWWIVKSEYGDVLPAHLFGDFPPTSVSRTAAIGEKYREFVFRDLYAKLNAPRFSGAVFLAELAETLYGIRDVLVGAVKVLLKAKESIRLARHFSLNSEELWLWYRYALMPAVLTANDLIAALEGQQAVNRIQDGLRGKTTIGGSCGQYFHKGLSNEFKASINWESRITYGCGGAMDVISRFDPQEWGTSANDVIAAGWEIIPFSFLFDWFVNVGDWLASLRRIETVVPQMYGTYAVQADTTFSDGTWKYLSDPLKVSVYVQERITSFKPPYLPLIDKEWANVVRVVDSITLTVGILKGILKRRR